MSSKLVCALEENGFCPPEVWMNSGKLALVGGGVGGLPDGVETPQRSPQPQALVLPQSLLLHARTTAPPQGGTLSRGHGSPPPQNRGMFKGFFCNETFLCVGQRKKW